MIKLENINLLVITIYFIYRITNFGAYTTKIDVVIHYIMTILTMLFIYRLYQIIKKELKQQ